MQKRKQFIKLLLYPILMILVLSSCSYGFFNFSDETGSLELEFMFSGDNTLGIDRIDYEITPPKGMSITLKENYFGGSSYRSIDNMDVGPWSIRGMLYSDGAMMQDFEYNVEIIRGEESRLRIEARWNSAEYDILFQSWQVAEGTYEPSEDPVVTVPSFSITDTRIMPAVFRDYRSGDLLNAVNTRIMGSGFDTDVKSVRLIYPDNFIYEYGYDDYNSGRTLLISHTAENNLIEIQRTRFDEGVSPNGLYRYLLRDYSGASAEYSKTVNLDYNNLIPLAVACNGAASIPVSIDRMVPNDFEYLFSSGAGIGTRLVMMVNRQTGQPYPADNTMAVLADSGILTIPGNGLPAGNYELIIASVEYSTLTPVDDAVAAGVSPDLRSEKLVQSLYELYRENTGFVCFTSVLLIFYN